MTSQESFRSALPAGHWFKNVAPLGEKPDWQVVPKPPEFLNEIPGPALFGYPEEEFMRRQYK